DETPPVSEEAELSPALVPVLEVADPLLPVAVPVLPPVVHVVADPEWSCATTIPMAAVTPAAARMAPRVRTRRRTAAFSRTCAGSACWGVDISDRDLIFRGCPKSHHAQLLALAMPTVGLLRHCAPGATP